MTQTSVGLVVRQQGWFRAHVDPGTVGPFPSELIHSVPWQPLSAFRSRLLIGRGPLRQELSPDVLFWFDHGEREYPVFQIPSAGPPGAGLKVRTEARAITATETEVICVIEISLIEPVAPTFPKEYSDSPVGEVPDAPAAIVAKRLLVTKSWLEQAIGLYALYQYPLVWEPIAIEPLVGFVDIKSKEFTIGTPQTPDNYVPFRLNVTSRIKGGQLVDAGLVDLARLAEHDLHFPLLLLQRALWQRNVRLRFLETFLLLDYLTSLSAVKDEDRASKEQLFTLLDEFVQSNHPAHAARIQSLKHLILAAPLRERMGSYLRHLKVDYEDETLRELFRLRNDLAHARGIDDDALARGELSARTIAREAMRLELASRNINFGLGPMPAV